jgi:DNA-binding NarL/FixJ family response regulator
MISTIREEFPMFVVIAVGVGTDVSAISRALFVGADGFVDAKAQPEEFMTALHESLEGQLVLAGLPPQLFGSVADGATEPPAGNVVLTARECQVLSEAARGLTAREIADRLNVRERTVTTHLTNVYGKLGVNGRIAAINLAVSRGLLDAPWAS